MKKDEEEMPGGSPVSKRAQSSKRKAAPKRAKKAAPKRA